MKTPAPLFPTLFPGLLLALIVIPWTLIVGALWLALKAFGR